MDVHSSALFLSSITILEIEDGIAKMARERGQRKAGPLKAWLHTVVHLYADRILHLDAAVARIAGQLSDRARSRGHAPRFPDVVIAATAAHHKLVILTRNLRHFDPLGVPAHDPFRAMPS